MKKSKGKSKTTNPCRDLTLEQGLKEIWFEMWSMYPFREGKIKAYYPPGKGPRYGATQPLTDKQIVDIEKEMGCPLELSALRAFLVQNCNESQLESLTRRDILRHILKMPDDLITLSVAIKKYSVSKITLRRAIKDENHPLKGHKIKSIIYISEKEVSKHWPER